MRTVSSIPTTSTASHTRNPAAGIHSTGSPRSASARNVAQAATPTATGSISSSIRPARNAGSGAASFTASGAISGSAACSIVSLSDAREKALSYRRQARDGGNPKIDARAAIRVVPTFKAAATQVYAEHRKTFKNAKHAAQWLQSLENDVFPHHRRSGRSTRSTPATCCAC